MKCNDRFQPKSRRAILAGAAFAGSFLSCCWPLWAQENAAAPEPAESEPASAQAEAAEAEKPDAEEPFDYTNWVELSVGGTVVDGPRSAFQQRYGRRADKPFGGVEDLHWQYTLGEDVIFKIDGRALFDQNDYSVKLDLSQPDKGYLRGGYRQFRTWYDGVGGFDRQNDTWLPLDDRDLHVDRGEAFVEAGLTLPDWPEFSVRYSHQFRDGRKDSTSWGTTSFALGFRGIAASFYDLDEVRDLIEGRVKHTLGKTDLQAGMRWDSTDIDNTLNLHQGAAPNQTSKPTIVQNNGTRTDLFNVHASSVTRFNEKYLLSAGGAYTTLDSDLSGSRVYGQDYDGIYDPGQVRGVGFLGLQGGSELRQYVFNANFHAIPLEHLSIVPSVRVEKHDLEGQSQYAETQSFDLKGVESASDFVDVSERLEARYSGLKNWVFYARGDWLQGEGDIMERQLDLNTATIDLDRDSDFTRFTQKYTAGLNWYPHRRVNLGGQYYHKTRKNEYDHNTDSTSNIPPSANRYPAFLRKHDFATDDVNARVSWRPINTLSLVTRYDFQLSTIDTMPDWLDELQTSELTSHIFSQSATWSPLHWLYLQGSLSYVQNETTTPISEVAPQVQHAENDYWTATFGTGFALDAKTDLEAQYYYTRADNYLDNSSDSQPYGAGFEEHGVTAGIVRRITQSLRWSLKYGFFSYRDPATAGNTDFTGHLVYSSLLYRF